MKKDKKTMEDFEIKCPECGADVYVTQKSNESALSYFDDISNEIISGDIIESYDIEFMELRCDSCMWSCKDKKKALGQMKKVQGIK